MSCHYSCSTCSSPTFADMCLTCPVSRTLFDTSCICSSNYYEYQSTNCSYIDTVIPSDKNINNVLEIVYFIMISISWFFILLNLSHIYSATLRTIITFAQFASLILEYRFRLSHLSEASLKIFSVWNFSYFNTLVCSSKSKPYQC